MGGVQLQAAPGETSVSLFVIELTVIVLQSLLSLSLSLSLSIYIYIYMYRYTYARVSFLGGGGGEGPGVAKGPWGRSNENLDAPRTMGHVW